MKTRKESPADVIERELQESMMRQRQQEEARATDRILTTAFVLRQLGGWGGAAAMVLGVLTITQIHDFWGIYASLILLGLSSVAYSFGLSMAEGVTGQSGSSMAPLFRMLGFICIATVVFFNIENIAGLLRSLQSFL